MGTTPRLQFPYPDPTTKIDIADDIRALAEKIDLVVDLIPPRMIIPYKGTVIPKNWAICDGTQGTPNLVDRFVIGAGPGRAVGPGPETDNIVLTAAQLPAHTHTATDTASGGNSHSHGGGAAAPGIAGQNTPNHQHVAGLAGTAQTVGQRGQRQMHTGPPKPPVNVARGTSSPVNDLASTGVAPNAAHTHTASTPYNVDAAGGLPAHAHSIAAQNAGGAAPIDIRPRFYTLVYIMKL
jgi:microcystin-dependent protein